MCMIWKFQRKSIDWINSPFQFSVSRIHVEMTMETEHIITKSIEHTSKRALRNDSVISNEKFQICVFVHKTTFICLYFVNAQWIVFGGLNSWLKYTLPHISLSFSFFSIVYARKIDFHDDCVTVLFFVKYTIAMLILSFLGWRNTLLYSRNNFMMKIKHTHRHTETEEEEAYIPKYNRKTKTKYTQHTI